MGVTGNNGNYHIKGVGITRRGLVDGLVKLIQETSDGNTREISSAERVRQMVAAGEDISGYRMPSVEIAGGRSSVQYGIDGRGPAHAYIYGENEAAKATAMRWDELALGVKRK